MCELPLFSLVPSSSSSYCSYTAIEIRPPIVRRKHTTLKPMWWLYQHAGFRPGARCRANFAVMTAAGLNSVQARTIQVPCAINAFVEVDSARIHCRQSVKVNNSRARLHKLMAASTT